MVFRAHTKLDLAVSNVLQVASFMQIVHLMWFVRSLYFWKEHFRFLFWYWFLSGQKDFNWSCLNINQHPLSKKFFMYIPLTFSILIFFKSHKIQKSVRDHSSITSSKRLVGGVRKWQFLMIYSTLNHQRDGWVGLKKSKTWWRNTWMVP